MEKAEKKKEKIDPKDTKIKELTENLQRLQADFENFQKRTEKQCQEFSKFANQELIKDILPILDNFELALKNTEDKDKLVKGVEMIFSQLHDILEKQGLKPIQTENKTFDPNIHEALMSAPAEQDKIILEEFQKGYILNEKVIRHSKVKVGKKN